MKVIPKVAGTKRFSGQGPRSCVKAIPKVAGTKRFQVRAQELCESYT